MESFSPNGHAFHAEHLLDTPNIEDYNYIAQCSDFNVETRFLREAMNWSSIDYVMKPTEYTPHIINNNNNNNNLINLEESEALVINQDPEIFLNYIRDKLNTLICLCQNGYQTPLKFSLYMKCNFKDRTQQNEIEHTAYFGTKKCIFDGTQEIDFNELFDQILTKFAQYISFSTKYEFDKIIKLDIQIDKYDPLNGGSFIELPTELKLKRSLVNIKNINDDYCYLYDYIAQKLYDENIQPENPNRPNQYTKYPLFREVINAGFSFPITYNQIPKFENMFNVRVNVYTYENKKINNSYISKYFNRGATELNLLLLTNETTAHYVWIKNFSAFIDGTTFNRSGEKVCSRCYKRFCDIEKYETHIQECCTVENVSSKDIMPTLENNKLSFKQFHYKQRVPFVIYSDFEAGFKYHQLAPLIAPFTQTRAEHHPTGVAFYTVSPYDVNRPPVRCVDENEKDLVNDYITKLEIEVKRIYQLTRKQNEKHVIWTDEAIIDYKTATKCHICEKDLLSNKEDFKNCNYCVAEFMNSKNNCAMCRNKFKNPTVVEHCHFTGKYRGLAHNNCNINFKNPSFIPVYFHNLDYDTHLFIKELIKRCEKDVSIIGENGEKYISYSYPVKVDEYVEKDKAGIHKLDMNGNYIIKPIYRELRFLDTFRFMASSLDTLATNLLKSDIDGTLFKHCVNNTKPELLKYRLQKGIYSYEYIDSFERLYETKLPPIERFYSSLTNKGVSQKDYNRAIETFNAVGCENILDYHNFYLETDVLLLADVFEQFRNVALKEYKIDPAWCYTAPELAEQAMLKITNVELELLTDNEMLLVYQKQIKGGISMISNRYAKSNNKYAARETIKTKIIKTYYGIDIEEQEIKKEVYINEDQVDKTKPISYIGFLDCNSLYPTGMLEPLPQSNFKWVDPLQFNSVINNIHNIDKRNSKISKNNLSNNTNKSSIGYTLEIDLLYPPELFEEHSDYPLAPEKRKVEEWMLSPYQKDLIARNIGSKPCIEKLLCHYLPREKYVIDYSTLALYMSLGLIVTKVHRIISFTQSNWMAPFIQLNKKLRTAAKNDFKKNFYKLMSNSVFGKTMENMRKRTTVRLIKSEKQFAKIRNNITRDYTRTIIDADLFLIQEKPKEIKFFKPIYSGGAILDISKKHMYDFYYNNLKKKYGSKIRLLVTDTDSLNIYVETEDFYKDMKEDIDKYDTSDFVDNHPSEMPKMNKKKPGCFKDEFNGVPIKEHCGLRSKMFSELDVISHEKLTAKGIPKTVKKSEIRHQMYIDTMMYETETYHSFFTFRSEKHNLETKYISKKGLSPYDDKRYLYDKLYSEPYGYYR